MSIKAKAERPVKAEKAGNKRKAEETSAPAAEQADAQAAKKIKNDAGEAKAVAEVATEPPSLTGDAFRRLHEIKIGNLPGDVPLWQTFDAAKGSIQAPLLKALLAAGFTGPTPIQAQAWPLAMTGRDILATAKTGSGKTCGFLIPSIARVLQEPQQAPPTIGGKVIRGAPTIVIMSPTRELAVQIQEQSSRFGRAAGLRSVAVYGGAPKGPQIRDLHSGAAIVIATPGRLNDLLAFKCQDGSDTLTLSQTKVLVLDEADRMCDMGFEDDIKKIVAKMPANRQTLFFTATWPKAVARVAASILRNPINVAIGSCDELRANKDIKQCVQVVDGGSKYDELVKLVKAEVKEGSRTIIFANKKYLCDEIESGLWEAGYSVAAIHGDKTQQEREWALGQMRNGKLTMLVATDVAARGLDIKGMDRVINYDFPNSVEDYVHRIGRTGRAGATGVAHTFFTHADAKSAGELVKIMREAKQEVPAELEALVQRRGGGGGGGNGKWAGNKWGGNKWGRNNGGGAKSWGKKW